MTEQRPRQAETWSTASHEPLERQRPGRSKRALARNGLNDTMMQVNALTAR
ncbi:MAG: hypothetical protein ABI182_05145 [Candidatus Baltobacteraceae bacterium]